MKYKISKFAGWFLLAISLWLVFFNYYSLKIYLVLIYSCAWIFLVSARGDKLLHQKEMLLCLQSGALSLLGYRVMERWLYVFQNKSIGGIHDEGSPLVFLIGSGVEVIVLSVLFLSLLEVFKIRRRTVSNLEY
jgi:hypothetical protein